MARGTKKTVEALEQKFETQKKPVQQDFFDLMASYYHKDEDLAFLISISKATLTDAQAGEDHTRFMTALRTLQAIQFWTRLAKLENLYTDVNNLIMTRINEMWSQLLATNDTDTQINTLGEIFLVLQNFNEWTGGIKSEFDLFHSLLRDLSGERVVKNTFENHGGRIGTLESLLTDMSGSRAVKNNFEALFSLLKDLSGERVVLNTFENHVGRISTLESLLTDMSGSRAVKNNFEALFSLLKDLSGERVVLNTFDSHNTRINTAQSRADLGVANAATAQSRADDAHNVIDRPSGSSETVWSRITGVYSYSTTVAGVVNQIETMLGGFTFGTTNVIKSYIDGSVDRLNGYSGAGSVKSDVDGVRSILSGFTGSGSVMNETQDIRNKLRDAGVAGF